MKTALLVVDVQNDFCEGGSLPVVGGAALATKISNHLRQSQYDFVVASKDMHIDPGEHWVKDGETPNYVSTWPRHCDVSTGGAQLHPNLLAIFDGIFHKGTFEAAYSAFQGVEHLTRIPLYDWLDSRGVVDLSICGIALDFCVEATLEDAVKNGFNVILLPDLTVAVDTDNHDKIWKEICRENQCLAKLTS